MRWIGCIGLMACLGLLRSSWALETELGQTYDSLNHGYADWHSTYLDILENAGDGKTIYGTVRETERFSLTDQELLAGAYYPLDSRWTALIEANLSPSHKVLPESSELLQIQRALSQGWGVHLGVRHTEYQSGGTVDIIRETFTLRRYVGNYRLAYTYFANQIEGGGTPDSNMVQATYYYGEHNYIGVTYAVGSEVLNLPPAPPDYYNVRSIALEGRHWFTPRLALTHELEISDEGHLYERKGIQLGIRYLF